MAHPIRLLPAFLALAAPLVAQQTTAEQTNYQATSSHADVSAFLDSLQTRTADITVGVLGVTTEGRSLPLVIAARPMVDGPVSAHRTGKPVVYLQANIHAGEVEGKEAAQMLLRDLTLGPLRPLLDSVVLLVVPIYNADGNDHFAPGEVNRPGQNGPGVVGQRANGQGLDLNRDYVKMEAPETRASVRLINAWAPDLFMDLHTTNGSYHGYALTYSPGLNPNGSDANVYVRDHLLPTVQDRMRTRHQQEIFPYGNFANQDPDSLTAGWYTYDPRPRFGTNWFGLRGRMAVLSEAYSNAPFRERVSATYNFVRELLSLVAEEGATVRRLAGAGDAWRPDSVGVRSDFAPPAITEVIAEITEPAGDGTGPFARRRRTGTFRAIRMPVYDRFQATRKEARPIAYLIPPGLSNVADLLVRQGVRVERLDRAWDGRVEAFHIDSLNVARLFQGHRSVSLEGHWGGREGHAGEGWFMVSTDQRLGTLATYLLEPASEDGIVTWNLADRLLSKGSDYPILRLRSRILLPSTVVDASRD